MKNINCMNKQELSIELLDSRNKLIESSAKLCEKDRFIEVLKDIIIKIRISDKNVQPKQ